MPFYVRYFDAEALLPKEEDIMPFIENLKMLNPKELNVLASYRGKLKSGTNRIFLDKSKKKYILAIGTDKTDISEFQKNARNGARPANPAPAEVPVNESLPLPDLDAINTGWFIYSLDYQLMVDGEYVPYTFKAKIKDVCLGEAYNMMADFVWQKHGEACIIPDLVPEVLGIQNVTD